MSLLSTGSRHGREWSGLSVQEASSRDLQYKNGNPRKEKKSFLATWDPPRGLLSASVRRLGCGPRRFWLYGVQGLGHRSCRPTTPSESNSSWIKFIQGVECQADSAAVACWTDHGMLLRSSFTQLLC